MLTGSVPELTLHIEEFMSGIDWTSLEEVDGGAVLRGSVSSNGSDVVTSYRMSVRDYESVPDATRKRWIYTLDTKTIERSGPEQVLLQQASYKFSPVFFPPRRKRAACRMRLKPLAILVFSSAFRPEPRGFGLRRR